MSSGINVPALLRLVYSEHGLYSFEPSAQTLCIAICEMLEIPLPWDGGPDPTGMWNDVPTPMVWEGEEITHAEPVGGGWCEKCLAGDQP